MTKKHHVRIGKDPERLNRGFWDDDADDYQAVHASQLDVETMGWGVWDLPETELNVLGDVTGLDVLEYGCGAAEWAIKLARIGAVVTGLDQSRGQLRHAAKKIAAASVSVELTCATATVVPFGDESFDIVFCDHGAMSFCDPYRTVPEVARVLRPGGLFAFNISTLLRNLCYPPGGPDVPVSRRLHSKWFGVRAFDWGDGTIDFQIPHGEWISLFRDNGLGVEDLLELRPPKHAKSTYGDYVDHSWGVPLALRGDLEDAEAVIRAAETALLVPVPEAEPLVELHRRAHDPVAPLGIPAHITILYPFIPPAAIDGSVEGKVAEVLQGFSAFDFELADVRCFPDGVLYLAPEPAEAFTSLTNAFAVRWPEHPPYDGSFTDIVPHLTVAMAADAPVAEIAEELRTGLPIVGRADAVWLMEGRKGGGWTQRAAFPLSGART